MFIQYKQSSENPKFWSISVSDVNIIFLLWSSFLFNHIYSYIIYLSLEGKCYFHLQTPSQLCWKELWLLSHHFKQRKWCWNTRFLHRSKCNSVGCYWVLRYTEHGMSCGLHNSVGSYPLVWWPLILHSIPAHSWSIYPSLFSITSAFSPPPLISSIPCPPPPPPFPQPL